MSTGTWICKNRGGENRGFLTKFCHWCGFKR